MTRRNRRDFLADVGRGTIAASLGIGLATDLGLAPARAGVPTWRYDVVMRDGAGMSEAGMSGLAP